MVMKSSQPCLDIKPSTIAHSMRALTSQMLELGTAFQVANAQIGIAYNLFHGTKPRNWRKRKKLIRMAEKRSAVQC